MCQAYEGKGDTATAQDYCSQAGKFNPLPQLDYAFIRAKAQKEARRDGLPTERQQELERLASSRQKMLEDIARALSGEIA